MSLLEVLLAILPVAVLEADQSKGQVDFSSDDVIRANLVLEEVADHIQMLKGFLVEVRVN